MGGFNGRVCLIMITLKHLLNETHQYNLVVIVAIVCTPRDKPHLLLLFPRSHFFLKFMNSILPLLLVIDNIYTSLSFYILRATFKYAYLKAAVYFSHFTDLQNSNNN